MPFHKVVNNEVFGSISRHSLPITRDSGEDITIVLEESVKQEEFTGETSAVDSFNKVRVVGKCCNIKVQVADRTFVRKAMTQPGADLSWMVCPSISFSEVEEMLFLTEKMRQWKKSSFA